MDPLQVRLEQCFAAVFPQLAEDEMVRASAASISEWDSLATMNLVAVVEEEFGINVGLDEIDEFVSFELILDYVKTHVS